MGGCIEFLKDGGEETRSDERGPLNRRREVGGPVGPTPKTSTGRKHQ